MGRLRKIFELANAKLPSYNSAFVKARGVALPLDTFLSGRMRFARKIGSPLPIWLPENQMVLSSRASATKNRLEFEEPNPWITLGSRLRINPGSFVIVDDILEGGRVVITKDPLITSYPSGTTVDLYGHPLETNGTYSPASTPVTPLPDDFVRDLVPRGSAVAHAATNQVLSGEPTIDGVATSAGDVILCTGQTDTTENGLWAVSPFSWSRPSNFSGGSTSFRSQVFVISGTVYAGTGWLCTSFEASSTISDPFSVPPTVGSPLTWRQLNNVTTFVVHSDQPIYRGDSILFKFFEYEVKESLSVGSLPDGRVTYQITINIGIPEVLEDGRDDQVYLRAYPAYESTQRPLPKIPLTTSGIGPFLFDRISGSFYEDLDVEEIDIIRTHSASGSLIREDVLRDGKNFLIYNTAIPSDSFLFWDRSQGRPNFSRSNQTFVATTDDRGFFHMHYKCVPEIIHKEDGFEGWRVQVTPQEDVYMVVSLEPNDLRPPFTLRAPGSLPPPPSPRGGLFLPAGVTTSVNIDFPEGSKDIEYIHLLFQSEAVLRSGRSAPFTLGPGTTLEVSVDGGPTQTVTFNPLDFADISNATASEVAGAINSYTSGLYATALSSGEVVLRSNNRGDSSDLHVLGGTANPDLDFPTTPLGGPSVPNVRIDMGSWETRGVESVSFVSHATIARVTGKNVWASSSAFAKPNWLRLAYLVVQTDIYSKFNSGLLST